MSPVVPAEVERRIEGFRPRKADVRAAMREGDVERIRAAVLAVAPEGLSSTSRMLSHAARHVAWVRRVMPEVPDKQLFAATAVKASIKAAQDAGGNPSPFCSDLRSINEAAAPKAVIAVPSPIEQPPPLDAYTPGEQRSLVAMTRGMDPEEARSLRAALALALGCGLVGQAASQHGADLITGVNGHPLVWSERAGSWIPVRQQWFPLLRESTGREPDAAATNMYSPDGRQRLHRRLERATSRPDLSSHRARNTWLAELLAAGVPVDVLGAAAAVLPSTLLRHLPPSVGCEVCARRSLRGDVPAPPQALIESLAAAMPVSPEMHDVAGAPAAVARDFSDLAPTDEGARAVWGSGLGEALTARAWAVSDDPARVRDLLCAASSMVTWSAGIISLPNTTAALLREATIERWEHAARATVPDATRAKYRSGLRALAGLTAPRGGRERNWVLPYSAEEQLVLWEARDQLSESDRLVFDAVWHLGLGAGVDPSGGRLAGTAVRTGEDGTVEVQSKLTWVVVHQEHELAVAGLAKAAGAGPIGGGRSRVARMMTEHRAVCTEVVLEAPRLRATWLARHLAAGVGLPALVEAAGSKFASIDVLCELIRQRSPVERIAWMIHSDAAARHGHSGECKAVSSRH